MSPLLALLIATYLFYPEGGWLARYDFLVLSAIAIQAALLLSGLETWEEARVILVFHVVGTVMEVSALTWIINENLRVVRSLVVFSSSDFSASDDFCFCVVGKSRVPSL